MLNHPRRRPQPIDAGSARFPPVGPAAQTLSELAAPDTAVLDAYVAQYGALFDRFEREHAAAERADAPGDERAVRRLPPLSTVPQVFFGSEFDLNKQYTFDLVTERYKQSTALGVESAETSSYGVVLNQMLQEKLSYYSDVIEQHLVVEIGARSASFFDALETLQRLSADTAACITQIDALLTHLDDVRQQVADGLRLASLHTERDELAQQEALLHGLRRLLERRDLLLLLVQHGELENALAVLDELRTELAQTTPLQALQPLAPQLRDAQDSIGAALQRELLARLDEAAHEQAPIALDVAHAADVPVDRVLPTPDAHTPELDADTTRLVSLLRCSGALRAALQAYADEASARLERRTRAALEHDALAWAAPLTAEDDAALARVRSEAWPTYVALSAALYRALLLGARECAAQDAMLRAAADSAEAAAPLDAATHAAWTRAQRIATQTLAARTPRLAEQTLEEFVPYFALSWRFVHLVEDANERAVVGLRSAVLAQAKAFLAHLHKTRIERAVRAVEEEVWAPAPVPAELVEGVARLRACAERDSDAYRIAAVLAPSGAPPVPPKADESQRTLVLGDQRYFVVRASGVVLQLLGDYVRVVVNLPMFAAETLGWIVEFLKQFNSRTCQVVLGAGAMRSAGLKNITARHLALASQSLSLMVSLIAPLRALCERHLRPAQAVLLTEFDKLQRDFSEHQLEIHAKLVAIMGDRIQVHARALAAQDWEAPTPDAQPSQAVQDLVRETGTLHRVMTQYLEPPAVQSILTRVFADMDASLATALGRVEIRSTDAHKRMQTDAEHVASKMRALAEPAWKGERLADAVQHKTPTMPPPSAARASMEKSGGNATPPLAYRPRFSFQKRLPATQSPRLNAMDAFDGSKESEAPARPSQEGRTPRASTEGRKEARAESPVKSEAVRVEAPAKPATAPPAAPTPAKDAPHASSEAAAPAKSEAAAAEQPKPPAETTEAKPAVEATPPRPPTEGGAPGEVRDAADVPRAPHTQEAPAPASAPAPPKLRVDTDPGRTERAAPTTPPTPATLDTKTPTDAAAPPASAEAKSPSEPPKTPKGEPSTQDRLKTPDASKDAQDAPSPRTKRSSGRVALQQRLAESMRRRAAKPKPAEAAEEAKPVEDARAPATDPSAAEEAAHVSEPKREAAQTGSEGKPSAAPEADAKPETSKGEDHVEPNAGKQGADATREAAQDHSDKPGAAEGEADVKSGAAQGEADAKPERVADAKTEATEPKTSTEGAKGEAGAVPEKGDADAKAEATEPKASADGAKGEAGTESEKDDADAKAEGAKGETGAEPEKDDADAKAEATKPKASADGAKSEADLEKGKDDADAKAEATEPKASTEAAKGEAGAEPEKNDTDAKAEATEPKTSTEGAKGEAGAEPEKDDANAKAEPVKSEPDAAPAKDTETNAGSEPPAVDASAEAQATVPAETGGKGAPPEAPDASPSGKAPAAPAKAGGAEPQATEKPQGGAEPEPAAEPEHEAAPLPHAEQGKQQEQAAASRAPADAGGAPETEAPSKAPPSSDA